MYLSYSSSSLSSLVLVITRLLPYSPFSSLLPSCMIFDRVRRYFITFHLSQPEGVLLFDVMFDRDFFDVLAGSKLAA